MCRMICPGCFRWLTLGVAILGILTPSVVPAQTNSYWTVLGIDPVIYDTPYHIALFNPQSGEDGARAWSQTKSVFFYGIGVIGVLVAMPEEYTGWEKDPEIFKKWVDNVTEGPEWDRNNWIYNYVGHAYFGGVYYQVARKSGYRQWDSFVYSFLMSTFYWEYGVEAFAETPSIQDLAVTPLLGWIYGEWAYQTEIGIRDRDNKIMGSKTLGGIALFLLDPIDVLGRGVNRVAGRRLVKAGHGYFTYTTAPTETATDHTIYLNVNVPFGDTHDPEPVKIHYSKNRRDPIDTGVVGIALGSGQTLLDEKWGMEDDSFTQISLGIYFTPRLSTRLSYAWGKVEEKTTGDSIIYENYSLDAQCYLNTKRKFRPYLTAGFGEQLFKEDLGPKAFQWNAGAGLHWRIHRKWALQADWIHYYSPSKKTYDQNINTGLVYRFGQGEHYTW